MRCVDQTHNIFEGENRAILIALLLSLVLHAALLLIVPQLRDAQQRRSYAIDRATTGGSTPGDAR